MMAYENAITNTPMIALVMAVFPFPMFPEENTLVA